MLYFHNSSYYCYNWLKKLPCVKEESLTDWILFDVSKNHDFIYYQPFSRNEEAFTGADWEWWVLVNDEYIGDIAYRFLIQAKKLKPKSNNYPIITYTNKNGAQIELLINEAKVRRALPLYAYYSTFQPDLKEQIHQINYLSGTFLNKCATCINGCYLASAYELNDTISGSIKHYISEEELVNASFKLSLLDYITPSDILSKLDVHYRVKNEAVQHFDTGITHLYENLPDYAKFLIEHRQEYSYTEMPFHQEIGNISGVGIIDLRKSNI